MTSQVGLPLSGGTVYALTFSAYVASPVPNANPYTGQTETYNTPTGPVTGPVPAQPAVNGILESDDLKINMDSAPQQSLGYSQLSTATFSSGNFSKYTLYFTDSNLPDSLTFTWDSSELSGPPYVEQQVIYLDDISLVAEPPGFQGGGTGVPDGGMTLSLLGFSLSLLALGRRFLARQG
jgi:hypothetical protein